MRLAAAARYLRLLHGQFADWPLAVADYNAGEGRVGRTLRQQGYLVGLKREMDGSIDHDLA